MILGVALRMRNFGKALTCWINTMFIGHDLNEEGRRRDLTIEMREGDGDKQKQNDAVLFENPLIENFQLTSQNFAPIWLPHCPP